MKEVTDPALIERLNAMRAERMQGQAPAQGGQEVTDPRLIAQLNTMRAQRMQQNQAPQNPAPESNAPSADRSMQDRILYAQLHQRSPLTPGQDEQGLNLAERAGSAIMDYAPYAIGAGGAIRAGGAALAKGAPKIAAKAAELAAKNPTLAKYLPEAASNMLGGGAYGAVNAPEGERASNAVKSAALGLAPTVASGAVIDPLLRYGAKKYAQTAIPEFTKKATEKLGELLPVSDYAKKLSSRFLSKAKENKANWGALENTAKSLDESLISPIRSEGKLIKIKGKNKVQNEVSNTDLMGNRINPLMIGKQIPLKQEISGYDAGGAPIFSNPDFGVRIKNFPETIKTTESVARGTPAISGQYGQGGEPIYQNGINFNNSPYTSYIENFKNKVGSMEPAIKAPYAQSLEVAEQAANMAPESFSGAVALRKNINQNMKDYLSKGGTAINPQNYQSKEFLTGLKRNLKNETIAAQEGKVSPEQLAQFKSEWEAANKSHQGLQKFYKSPQKSTGVEAEGRTVREAFKASLPKEMGGEGLPLDPALISKYIPSLSPTGAKGIEGLKQLSKVMGSKKEGVEAAKAHLFDKQLTNGANTVDSAARYAALSKTQKKYLFGNSDEGKMLEAINKTRLAFGREPEKTLAKIGHGVLGYGLPGVVGYGGSYLAGENNRQSLLNALALTGGSKLVKGIGAKTANPSRVNRAINFGNNGTTNSGRNLNALMQVGMNPNQRNQ